jgi:hypothetical protein
LLLPRREDTELCELIIVHHVAQRFIPEELQENAFPVRGRNELRIETARKNVGQLPQVVVESV